MKRKVCKQDCTLGTLGCDSLGRLKDCKDICNKGNIIDIKGVCTEDEVTNILQPEERAWTQIDLPEVLCLPDCKPDIEQLLSVSAKVDIISQRIVRTPVLTVGDPPVDIPVNNAENLISTGRKLIIEGILRQKINYVALNKEQSVHAAYFDVPFSAFIVLEANSSLIRMFNIKTCIEDIFISSINKRQIFKNVTLFLNAVPVECTIS